MNEAIKTAGLVALGMVLMVLLVGVGIVGISTTDKTQCEEWQEDAIRYPYFYITEWQKAQCDYYEIEIDAPVQ